MSEKIPATLHPCVLSSCWSWWCFFFFCEDVLATQIQLSALAETLGMKKQNLSSHFCIRRYLVLILSSMPSSCLIKTHQQSRHRLLPPGWWWQRFGGFQVGTTEDHQRAAKVETGGAISSWFPDHRWGWFIYLLLDPRKINHLCS